VNFPNALTILRFFLIPVFAYFLCKDNLKLAATFFILAAVTDFFDGHIARKYNKITDWGKVADPLADKLMTITALFILTFVKDIIPASLIIIVFIKEVFMVIGGVLLYKQNNYVVSAKWYGKLATVIFFFAIVMIILDVQPPFLPNNTFIIIALIATLFAFFMYLLTFISIKKKQD